jgi:hypothetical protein
VRVLLGVAGGIKAALAGDLLDLFAAAVAARARQSAGAAR